MNPALIVALLALGGFGGASAIAHDCHDLAGQGYLCAEADEGGADVELYVEPSLPSIAAHSAAAECQPIDGLGEVCHDLGEESGSVSWDLSQEDIGFESQGELEYHL